jgi:hypothetical protein
MSFEWKLPLEDHKGKKVESFRHDGDTTSVRFLDGTQTTLWTDSGHQYADSAKSAHGDPDVDHWVVSTKPEPKVVEYVPTDPEVAAKYRETINIAKGFYDILTERGYSVVDPRNGNVLEELCTVSIIKEIRL